MSARTARRSRNQESWASGKGHPSTEVLRAYQRGELARESADRLRDHFVLCPQCTQTLLDLAAFFNSEPTPGRQDPEEVLAAWDDLVRTLPVR